MRTRYVVGIIAAAVAFSVLLIGLGIWLVMPKPAEASTLARVSKISDEMPDEPLSLSHATVAGSGPDRTPGKTTALGQFVLQTNTTRERDDPALALQFASRFFDEGNGTFTSKDGALRTPGAPTAQRAMIDGGLRGISRAAMLNTRVDHLTQKPTSLAGASRNIPSLVTYGDIMSNETTAVLAGTTSILRNQATPQTASRAERERPSALGRGTHLGLDTPALPRSRVVGIFLTFHESMSSTAPSRLLVEVAVGVDMTNLRFTIEDEHIQAATQLPAATHILPVLSVDDALSALIFQQGNVPPGGASALSHPRLSDYSFLVAPTNSDYPVAAFRGLFTTGPKATAAEQEANASRAAALDGYIGGQNVPAGDVMPESAVGVIRILRRAMIVDPRATAAHEIVIPGRGYLCVIAVKTVRRSSLNPSSIANWQSSVTATDFITDGVEDSRFTIGEAVGGPAARLARVSPYFLTPAVLPMTTGRVVSLL